MPFSAKVYGERRLQLVNLMKEGIAIIPTALECARSRDTDFSFRPDSHFYYLTGFAEPEAVLIVVAGEQEKNVLFCRERDAKEEQWVGKRLGLEGAKKVSGVDEVYPISSLDKEISWLLIDQRIVYLPGKNGEWVERIKDWFVDTQIAMGKFRLHDQGDYRNVYDLLDEMRLIKQLEEMTILRRAAVISANALCKAMKTCLPGMMEYGLEAELIHEFRHSNSTYAFQPIVAGGENACLLHYMDNNCQLKNGDLVLMDIGCELDCYASDITRTFPVNGKFSREQKIIYKIVLAAQEAAIKKIKPGINFLDLYKMVIRILTAGLIKHGLLIGEVDQLVKNKAYERFFMHGVGHCVGLDVHDSGSKEIRNGQRVLESGMILTVEPGIYIQPDDGTVDPKWRGIGVRIEDTVLVTDKDCEILTSAAPKKIKDIEALMKE
ncbi:MAG: aminopeptidase P N-terminal domain-containing protein [Candidatus Portnoybacteria bacterium]|nr:aminopeptidase P N-terminal domain-containing protein [Candidatus Portnoybacteria bacterium]